MFTGKIVSSEKALEYGVFNFIEEKLEIENSVNIFAENIINRASQDSLRLTKELINNVQSLNLDNALKYASEMNATARATADCKKGISAFLNKEKISW